MRLYEFLMLVYVMVAAFIIVMVALPSSSATLDCDFPSANVTRGLELCEELRLSLRVRSADWSNDMCATQFFRIGMLEGERRSTTRAVRAELSSQVSEAVEDFRSTWPAPAKAVCGDGILDEEFGEECDDDNLVNGDGCSNACGIE